MTEGEAELVAIRALGWLAADDERWPVFLSASGAEAAEVRSRVGDPAFLRAVLDFITFDDATVMAFCDSAGLAYDRPLRARQALPGGAEVNWT